MLDKSLVTELFPIRNVTVLYINIRAYLISVCCHASCFHGKHVNKGAMAYNRRITFNIEHF